MTHEAILLNLNLLLWLFFAYRFVMAVKHRKVNSGVAVRAWGVVFCMDTIAASTVPGAEALIDAQFGGLPITNLARSVMILVTAQFIMLIVRPDSPLSAARMRFFLWVNPLLAVGIVFIFIGFVQSGLPYGANYTLIKVIRSAIMTGWMLVIVLPTFTYLWRIEQVRPMKLRYGISAVLGVLYLIQCISSISAVIATITASPLEGALLQIADTSSYLCIGLFIAIMIPYRWLMPVFYPRRLRVYRRLQQLEALVILWSTAPPLLPNLPLNLTNVGELELGIYQKVISILDMLSTMKPAGAPLRARIEAVVNPALPFPELAERLAALR